MSKYVKTTGDFTIKTSSNGTITLDTGTEVGEVRITGDLRVQGVTTTVNSEVVTIKDNIITLNSGETGAGVSSDVSERSGITIDRGSSSDVFLAYHDDTADDINPGVGLFRFYKDGGSRFVGIATNHISTTGTNLYLINANSGVVTVGTSLNYENRVVSPNHMPNKQYVDNAITTAFATVLLPQIGDGDVTPSGIIIKDEETTGVDSVIDFTIDDSLVAQVYADSFEFQDIRISGTTIETMTTDSDDLVIRAFGDGSVRIEDTLAINKISPLFNPSVPDDGIKLYVSQEYSGKTGLFFVNEKQTRDELVSKNRSMLFSMLF